MAVRDAIVELAGTLDGVFIVVDGLDECSSLGDNEFEMLCQFIASLGSKDLSGAYRVSLERIISQDESSDSLDLRALLWVANSVRRLSREEFHEALIIEEGMEEVTDGDRLGADFSMVEQCADLLILRDNSYELVHSSLGEYLRSLLET
ncbi:hypothetical protein GGTG_12423 [Gaeumannomyces tritici R3-111a-1]|uniref:NACHT domain-containing protein n=1 Tax=Gaeumannomyces tritici (strain R3-111a-1) TaxID=644352 RepID=J3PFZ8_GAET3|nr:hypothetical protein GGTG_12423 [Gaeumannomyces tritici R3-111a-1]EJT70250.1 hypothetical protein GGTG_12423 [Gaeumannomyces tritici R3-111a-1]